MQRLRCEASNDELLRTMMIIEELSPYWGLIGIKIEDVGRDCAVGFVEIGRKHLQILGTVHGGVHAALADAIAWVAIISHYYPRYVIAVTTDLTVKYLRPITEGVLKAVARITHIKEPMALITVELRNKSNELIGTSTATYWVTLTNKSLNDLINELRGKT